MEGGSGSGSDKGPNEKEGEKEDIDRGYEGDVGDDWSDDESDSDKGDDEDDGEAGDEGDNEDEAEAEEISDGQKYVEESDDEESSEGDDRTSKTHKLRTKKNVAAAHSVLIALFHRLHQHVEALKCHRDNVIGTPKRIPRLRRGHEKNIRLPIWKGSKGVLVIAEQGSKD
ncbi:hypothetical protein ACP70R_049633 [Stipagrostis hirtigluma subsp. patula]